MAQVECFGEEGSNILIHCLFNECEQTKQGWKFADGFFEQIALFFVSARAKVRFARFLSESHFRSFDMSDLS